MRRLTILLPLFAIIARAEIPEPFNTETAKTSPMPAAEAAAKMQLPDGFRATVFAAEPDVRQPIGMALDAALNLFQWDRVALILIAIVVIVIVAEVVVTQVRKRVI